MGRRIDPWRAPPSGSPATRLHARRSSPPYNLARAGCVRASLRVGSPTSEPSRGHRPATVDARTGCLDRLPRPAARSAGRLAAGRSCPATATRRGRDSARRPRKDERQQRLVRPCGAVLLVAPGHRGMQQRRAEATSAHSTDVPEADPPRRTHCRIDDLGVPVVRCGEPIAQGVCPEARERGGGGVVNCSTSGAAPRTTRARTARNSRRRADAAVRPHGVPGLWGSGLGRPPPAA